MRTRTDRGLRGQLRGILGASSVDRLQRRHENGFSRGSRQQAKASRPDGFSPRRRLAKERAGSAKNITPKRETRRSKLAGSNGYTVASASTKSTGRPAGATWRARASIGPEMSMPSTCPLGPTFCASAIEMAPLPQPTSMMRSPASGLGAVDQDVGDRRQQDVLRLLPIGPLLAARVRSSTQSGRRFDRRLSGFPSDEYLGCGIAPPSLLRNSARQPSRWTGLPSRRFAEAKAGRRRRFRTPDPLG